MSQEPKTQRIFSCPECGSAHVLAQMWCFWNIDTQTWDDCDDDPDVNAVCNNCDWTGSWKELGDEMIPIPEASP